MNIKHSMKNPDNNNNNKAAMRTFTRRSKKMAMAKRGIRSLAIAVAFPLSLTLINIYFFSSKKGYDPFSNKPFWFPPTWVMHLTYLASTLLMALSSWLVWAEGGFHNKPSALSLYMAQLGLGLIWNPVVYYMGGPCVCLVFRLAIFGALLGCSRQFKEVNPIAGDLVKPCLAWAAFLAIVNLKHVFL